mmetsp:Transcript_22090/g.51559  ORF Transcript_22090/g.51559 Transcript_22090/m.51559 type:complete len:599 (-) Transcript_22090:87-1883(-)
MGSCVLCGWLLGWIVGAYAQGNTDDSGKAATAPTGTPARNAVSQVVLKTAASWGFNLDNNKENVGIELWADGSARPHFQCGAEALVPALDDESLAARKLELSRTPASWTLLANWGDQSKERELQVTNASLLVLPVDPANTAPILLAKLEQPLPNGTTVEAQQGGSIPINVEYDCLRQGHAMIELRMQVLGEKSEMCVQWKKACRMGWHNLQVSQANLVAVKDGNVTEEWTKEMVVQGTYDVVTKLELSARGLLRLGQPRVITNSDLLAVDIRGPLSVCDEGCEVIASDSRADGGTQSPGGLSILYTCYRDGPAEVVLTLIKAGEAKDELQLRWKKICGETVYHNLQVWLKSDTYKNSTLVVEDGKALPGFMRPCRGVKATTSAAIQRSTTRGPPVCEASALTFEVPPKDRRTSLELRMDKEATSPPDPKPLPTLSYNRKLMQVTLVQPRSAAPGGSSTKHKLHALHVKYTCFKDGIGVVEITLHLPGHTPIDVAWNKRCTEPKVRVGKATMTAPQAILVTVVISSIVALVCCLIFIFCGQDEKRSAFSNSAMGGDDEELELAGHSRKHNFGASRAGVPQRLGASSLDSDDEGEVTFHD